MGIAIHDALGGPIAAPGIRPEIAKTGHAATKHSAMLLPVVRTGTEHAAFRPE